MLNKKINADVDDLKSASNRILVRILLITVAILFSINYRHDADRINKCEESIDQLTRKNDSLSAELQMRAEREKALADILRFKSDSENARLRTSKEWMEKIANDLKLVLKKDSK